MDGWKVSGISAVVVLVSFLPVSFPSEIHGRWSRYPLNERHRELEAETTYCNLTSVIASLLSPDFDRLKLAGGDFGSNTFTFDDRDFACGDFERIILRRSHLDRTTMVGAKFDYAELQGTSMDGAQLDGASFYLAHLDGATLSNARLDGANLTFAQLREAHLEGTQLRSAVLSSASMQGASFRGAQLQGTYFGGAWLQGTSFNGAQIQGAYFSGAQMAGAVFKDAGLGGTNFKDAALQGASFQGARLEGVSFAGARLQGVSFIEATSTLVDFSRAFLWRTGHVNCDDALLEGARFEPIIGFLGSADQLAKPDDFDKWLQIALQGVPDSSKEYLSKRLREDLGIGSGADTPDNFWRACKGYSRQQFEMSVISYLVELTCQAGANSRNIAKGIVVRFGLRASVVREFVRGLLRPDRTSCPGLNWINEATKASLRNASEISDPSRSP
jgi:uncharacterized protein YjbI with pentapeptide repeats